jgi:hypothetical protein
VAETLSSLGFTREEIHKCEAAGDGRIVVNATIAGEPARLLLDTTQRIDLSLSLGYVRQRGWPYTRRDESWGTSPLTDFAALGRSRPHDPVSVEGREDDPKAYYTVGKIGTQLVGDALLAIDPVEWTVGVSRRAEVRDCFARATHRLVLLPNILDNLPLTNALADSRAPEHRPVFMLDTEHPSSVLSLEFTEHCWSSTWRRWSARRACRRDGTLTVSWSLPAGGTAALDMRIVAACTPRYPMPLGADTVHGYLGLDFLYRWLPLFDFPGRQLALFDFAAVP